MKTNSTELLRVIAKYQDGHRYYMTDILLNGKTAEFYSKDFERMNVESGG